MSWFSGLMGGGNYKNPADSAMPYFDQVPGKIDQYMNPYISRGNEAGDILSQQYGQYAQDPTGVYDDIYSSYEMSPYAQYQLDQMQKGATATAASGGYVGTDSDIQKQTELQNALMSMDFDKYLSDILGIQGQGMQGENNLYNTGFGASNNALQGYMGNLNNQASLAYSGQANQNQRNMAQQNALLKSLFGGAGAAAYEFF